VFRPKRLLFAYSILAVEAGVVVVPAQDANSEEVQRARAKVELRAPLTFMTRAVEVRRELTEQWNQHTRTFRAENRWCQTQRSSHDGRHMRVGPIAEQDGVGTVPEEL
jgi:hypothetical protein